MRLCIPILLFALLAAPVAAEPLETDVLRETNAARKDPRGYAKLLKAYRKQFKGKYVDADGERLETMEGVQAVDEAIRHLERQSPLPSLEWSDGLASAAAEVAREQEKSGETGHSGVNVPPLATRIRQYGTWGGTIGENLSYGPETGRSVVMQLIIDDGVPSRGHRKNIFNEAFRKCGVSCGPHPTFGTVCVMDFAGDFTPAAK